MGRPGKFDSAIKAKVALEALQEKVIGGCITCKQELFGRALVHNFREVGVIFAHGKERVSRPYRDGIEKLNFR